MKQSQSYFKEQVEAVRNEASSAFLHLKQSFAKKKKGWKLEKKSAVAVLAQAAPCGDMQAVFETSKKYSHLVLQKKCRKVLKKILQKLVNPTSQKVEALLAQDRKAMDDFKTLQKVTAVCQVKCLSRLIEMINTFHSYSFRGYNGKANQDVLNLEHNFSLCFHGHDMDFTVNTICALVQGKLNIPLDAQLLKDELVKSFHNRLGNQLLVQY